MNQQQEEKLGADISLPSIHDRARNMYQPLFDDAVKRRDLAKTEGMKAEWQHKVEKYHDAMYPEEGYFRDSYNASSVFQVMALSWWELGDKLLDETGHLPVDKAKELLELIEQRSISYEAVTEQYEQHKLHEGGESIDEWFKYFVEKRERFMALLRKSIELNEPLLWSI
jgi:hypothetical protein